MFTSNLFWQPTSQQTDPMQLDFAKGYTPTGFAEKVYHIHVPYFVDWDELYFRNCLLKYENIAHQYQELKLRLWKNFEHNRDGYTDAKSEFIRYYNTLAKQELKNKYTS